ncbi:hypothetical protein [Spongiactinospora rosea]|nr:hypothetical protein [Spongiactinospora rosea]
MPGIGGLPSQPRIPAHQPVPVLGDVLRRGQHIGRGGGSPYQDRPPLFQAAAGEIGIQQRHAAVPANVERLLGVRRRGGQHDLPTFRQPYRRHRPGVDPAFSGHRGEFQDPDTGQDLRQISVDAHERGRYNLNPT